VKAAGNYAAALIGDKEARARGFDISLYLDSATHEFIDEFTTSNFIGITRDRRYVTPDSTSVLPSVTNDSLQRIAADLGCSVERRPVRWDELGTFSEIGACGTAAVITPVHSLTRGSETLTFGDDKAAGPVLTSLSRRYSRSSMQEGGSLGWIHRLTTFGTSSTTGRRHFVCVGCGSRSWACTDLDPAVGFDHLGL
jgi:branched-subunit amino acid aminotransferase/4-amino-4-deoxychorismate lyase